MNDDYFNCLMFLFLAESGGEPEEEVCQKNLILIYFQSVFVINAFTYFSDTS